MLAHGFTIEMLIVLVRDGFATATPEIVHAGRRPIEVVRVGITDGGRQALDCATTGRADRAMRGGGVAVSVGPKFRLSR